MKVSNPDQLKKYTDMIYENKLILLWKPYSITQILKPNQNKERENTEEESFKLLTQAQIISTDWILCLMVFQ